MGAPLNRVLQKSKILTTQGTYVIFLDKDKKRWILEVQK